MAKTKLRTEIIEALRTNQTCRLKLAIANGKTEMTIRNWIGANDPMLTTVQNVEIICTELRIQDGNDIFALEL